MLKSGSISADMKFHFRAPIIEKMENVFSICIDGYKKKKQIPVDTNVIELYALKV